MRTVVRVGTGSQFVRKLKRTEENRHKTVFLGFDCSSRCWSVYTAVIVANCIFWILTQFVKNNGRAVTYSPERKRR